MKKLIIIGVVMFMFIIVGVGGVMDTQKRQSTKTYEPEDTCTYGNGKIDDPEVEVLRDTVTDRLSNPSLTNAVLGIYMSRNKRELDTIIDKMNDLYEYSVDNKLNPLAIAYIQAYVYGEDFLLWLAENNKTMDVATTKEYMTSIGRNNNEYRYFVDVMSLIAETCAINTDGLPLDKPYRITGWFPTYGKDGGGDTHYGIDIGVPVGTVVYAIADGIVLGTYDQCDPEGGELGNKCGLGGTGNYVYYSYEIGDETYYVWCMHMKQPDVKGGDHIVKGQKIGLSGHSGNSSGAHLHIEIQSELNVINKPTGVKNPCEMIVGLCE